MIDDVSDSALPSETEQPVSVHLSADISAEWSWVSSAARIPQISSLIITASEEIPDATVTVTLHDGEEIFGSKEMSGVIPAGQTKWESVHIPLSARAMATVDERRAVECVIEFAGSSIRKHLSRAVDLQPRDLWYRRGDPRRGLGGAREDTSMSSSLGESLLASFVRPNHPEVALIAREAAAERGRATGKPNFSAFQLLDLEAAQQAVEDSITAIYVALQRREIAYSEPPPGWDYDGKGQRIRDHGAVAQGGLGTCLDTTVLTAAVIEHVGLHPVMILVPGHIFIGYWRRNPFVGNRLPDWYSGTPTVFDISKIIELVDGGWLGVLETTTLAVGGSPADAQDARSIATGNVQRGLAENDIVLIDVIAARRSGVSPLPAIRERQDGVIELVEYRPPVPGGVPQVDISPLEKPTGPRFVDSHPPRYRTWKSSLFGLNATNALLNLGDGPSVQPIVLPPEGLGLLEDRLNQDVEFTLSSGYDVSEVYRARDVINAARMDADEQLAQLNDRVLYVQRFSSARSSPGPVSPAKFASEVHAMARRAKEARDERGMNPLFLCVGLLRWTHKPGSFAEAPLILVPVRITVRHRRGEFALALDTSSHTTPNVALLEWLRREHDLTIPELAEPTADHAGVDVDGVLAAVRRAVAERGLPFDIASEARLALLDLSAFRMWKDTHENGDTFLEMPLVRHLVNTPANQFIDPAAQPDGNHDAELEKLETPVPADATQKTAVLWARQGRTFVLQGPPGTGKSQTITNLIAECLLDGKRVLFVAEKGTALDVVARRLAAVGLSPFTLNLHHEGSNAAEVRAQLKRALAARTAPDSIAMEDARRRLRNARYELDQYPQRLHRRNAAALSAYESHDRLLVLGEGPATTVPDHLVATPAAPLTQLADLFAGVQAVAAAAGPRAGHPWRFIGRPTLAHSDLDAITEAVRGVLIGLEWAEHVDGPLRNALQAITHPAQLATLAAACDPRLPEGAELRAVLDRAWPEQAQGALRECERIVEQERHRLHGYRAEVLHLDLQQIIDDRAAANASSLIGRAKRQTMATAPLNRFSPDGTANSQSGNPTEVLRDLITAKSSLQWVVTTLAELPGIDPKTWPEILAPNAFASHRRRYEDLVSATATMRDQSAWHQHVRDLAVTGALAGHGARLVA